MEESPSVQNIPSHRLGESRQKEAIIGMCIATALSSAIVFVRIYARATVIQQFGWDDLVITLAMILSWSLLPLLVMVIYNGGGRHLRAVLSEDTAGLDKMTVWMAVSSAVYTLNLVVCRISGILFYARLNSMPRFMLYLRFTFIFVVAVFIAQVVFTTIRCIPISAMWERDHSKRCFGIETITFNTVLTLFADILILLLPTDIILSMKATLDRKIVLGIILSFGIFAIITSVGRIIAVFDAMNHVDDITWYISAVMIWTSAEICTAIIALSLPALKGLCGIMLHPRSLDLEQNDSRREIQLDRAGSSIGQEAPIGPNSYRKEVPQVAVVRI